jgi:HlyD family type I secretion membrane fusion protein
MSTLITSDAHRTSDADSVADWKRPALVGYVLIATTFFGIGGWSAFAKLDSAVLAPGVVAAESNRKTVQHLEGGIIREILVREGQRVTKGDILFRMDTTQAQANFEVNRNQLDSGLAQEARLIAERDGANEVTFPQELRERENMPVAARAMSDQVKEFNERSASLSAQIDVLKSRIVQYQTEIEGLTAEQAATKGQLGYIVEELNDLTYLLEKNLVQKSRVLALQREKSRLEGVVGRTIADQAKAKNGINEADLQIRQLRQKLLEEVSGQTLEVRQKIAELREKVRVSEDIFRRVEIVAPVSGTVQGLKVFTVGGVIRAGEPLLDIFPDHDELIVQAHVSPNDMESLTPGMRAEVRFSSFRTNLLPLIIGRVESVSRDRLVDEQIKQAYFLAQVVVDDLPDEVRGKLTAGMPAELVFPTGERTILDYLVRPLKNRMNSALREK